MIKLQDFARQVGVTDRQIQRLLKKYEEEFEGLFDRKGQNGTWLSDEACELLRSKMRFTSPEVFAADPRVEEMKAEIEALKAELFSVQSKYTDYVSKTTELLQTASEQKLLAEASEENKKRAEEAEQKAADLERRAIEARQRETEATVALEKAEAKVEEAKKVTQTLIEQADKAKADAKASEDMAAELKAKYEKFEAAMEEYSKLPAWKRLFVKPPKMEE